MKKLVLNNNVEIPALGLGTFRSEGEGAYKAVLHALKSGYRLIDTAAAYGNEEAVGRAIRDAGIPREDIFVTTKLWKADLGYMSAKRAFHASLKRLGLDYLDLYLIHWPGDHDENKRSWRALEDLYFEGAVRSIGVSNFSFHHLEHLLEDAEIVPQVNQVETHLYLQNKKLQDFCMANGIHLEAYAPLLSKDVKTLLSDETLGKIAEKHNKTPAQTALRFLVENEIVPLPKSVTPSRIEENLNVFDFELEKEDFDALRQLNRGKKTFPDPDNFLV